ncbi:sensor histidine kinase [Leptospira langatensis]|uniref:Sensor histidine kinase n=1 Tax=Leptospira langatensis TaxID=2484983 RepID=A0A5F1ZX54_9LEPT|nr:sensor histidine kinase [Leptospira langatensis]TGJ98341.1 sensor histidine kinase [Leptospira langatensis]TGL43254.1 sensor histidine kinase [Leptospira langatensis]
MSSILSDKPVSVLPGSIETRVLFVSPDSVAGRKIFSELSEYTLIFSNSPSEGLDECLNYSPQCIILNVDFDSTDDLLKFVAAFRRVRPQAIVILFLPSEYLEKEAKLKSIIPDIFDRSHMETILRKELRGRLSSSRSLSDSNSEIETDVSEVISELEWLVWKETSKSAKGNFPGRNIIDNLTNTLAQGLGIGPLLSRLEMVEIFLKKGVDVVRIPKDLMASILENKNRLRERNESLDRFKNLFDLKVEKKIIPSSEMGELVSKIVSELGKVAAEKGQNIQYDVKIPDVTALAHMNFLEFAFQELFANALKFSPADSTITSYFFVTEDRLVFRVINDILSVSEGITGIPEEFGFRLFEPFFKLNNIFDERFYKLEFGMGMGLNLIQSLAKQVDCKVFVAEIPMEGLAPDQKKIYSELRFLLSTESAGQVSDSV